MAAPDFNSLRTYGLATGQARPGMADIAGGMEIPMIGGGDGFDWGGTAKGFGSIAGGIGGLAQAWQGIQGLKLAKKQLAQQNDQWEKNYAAQRGDIAHDRATRGAYRNKMRGGSVV